ncbi:hypothetical protein PC9H_000439 [Pleurotus ostreatus]|uniref:Fungal N-terminal domain-containing protein n=1 Tax=Pleurotus ostreatus TaxID=5322 RepID=A0A8H7A137_PLEOS|nr:uncharacterized protein PC9H_000439 [Pleurotus ostreatus]KAF7440095.1 hypothetical protein PC9H_000439 [Pleurotus ostreatus]KAJ8700648.1 hypothetical protein PTI98_003656 [Pleurotus ostreatus]
MDPLSITAAVVSFVDIAKRIKDSVDKVGQTRRNLQQLVENIVDELTALQKLCQGGGLNRFDPDSTRSLEKLHSDLINVLERCQKLTEQRRTKTRLSSARYYVIAWLKDAEIEGHILRLRDRVSSVHRRFTMIASLRAERADHELLVATSDIRGAMHRMETLLSPFFIASHESGTYPASSLDRTAQLDGFDYQFLHRQVRRAADLLGRISATQAFTVEETRGPICVVYRTERRWPSRPSLMRMATIETLQLLELDPSDLALWEGAVHLLYLGKYLFDLRLEDDAAAICVGVVNLYQALMRRNPRTYLPCVAWGLELLSCIHFGTTEGLDAAKRAVDICRETAAVLQEDYRVDLAHSLRLYSNHLAANGCFDEALVYAVEALAMQRQAPLPQHDPDCPSVCWEASGEEHVALSSARTICRPYDSAIDEMLCLGIYAQILRSVGRWSEALIIATEAVRCADAFAEQRSFGFTRNLESWVVGVHEEHRIVMARICAPRPPLSASIDDVDELDELDSDDSSRQGGSDAQSAALVRT